MAKVYQGGASIDERGKATGGKAGNQTGAELRKRLWYVHKKGWYILRAKRKDVRKAIARYMRRALANLKIGYDQGQRYTLYNQIKPLGFDPGKATKVCECDCSTLIATIVQAAFAECGIGITVPIDGFRTSNEVSRLLATGEFELLTSAMYCANAAGDYLLEGDIACTRTQGHTIAILNDGAKVTGSATESVTPTISKGARGEAVKTVQTLLRAWRPEALPEYGIDSDFGDETDRWVQKFQRVHALVIDGVVGPKTWMMLGAYAVVDLGGEDDGIDEEADGATPDPTATAKRSTLSRGDSGYWVKELQRALMTWNGFALPRYGMDSDFGGETEVWVARFQTAMGITVDGIAGPATWEKIDMI